jgi:hypothetical protein
LYEEKSGNPALSLIVISLFVKRAFHELFDGQFETVTPPPMKPETFGGNSPFRKQALFHEPVLRSLNF